MENACWVFLFLFCSDVATCFRVQDQKEQKLANTTVPLKKLVHVQIRSKCWDLIIYRNTVLR